MATLVSDALGSIEGVEEALGVTLTADQRDVVTRILNGVTGAIHKHTARKLKSRNYTPDSTPEDSIFDGEGFNYLYLPQYPVTALTTLAIDLTEYREIVRRPNTAVTATTLTSGGGFSFSAQDAELSRGIASISPSNSTEVTEAVITSIAGATATFSAGWNNGTPAVGASWWFQEGVYLTKKSGKLEMSHSIFEKGNKNIRASYTAGYVSGDSELDYLLELSNSLAIYIFQKGAKSGYLSETMGSYSYRLEAAPFKDFWNMNDINGLDQFINLRKLL